MPELPEVETVRRGLDQQTRGMTVAAVEVRLARTIAHPQPAELFCVALQGCSLQHWQRRGKYLLATLTDRAGVSAGTWGVHLRMTGQFLWLPESAEPCRHTRVRFFDPHGNELRYVDIRSFGQMWWVPPDQAPAEVISGLQRLGPEPFSPEFTASHLQRALQGSSRPIKNALLDQRLVAGVGNIYADESLFEAGIRPHTPAGQLKRPQLERLHGALLRILRASIGAGGTTFSDFRDLTGTNGNYGGVAWVYRRGGEPCRRCGTVLRRDKLAGRSSHWCPLCQQ
ncbi:DNA-formamidopyrimidine glycosylase [Synechococcus sp. CBW1002]|uniref:DNA-formamidopyrimidine glycosylase n=1 Tax=Synechococcus sp. CBW1002 TaxID=1353134 RepID=UPI0018CD34C5|nr:DNA-formamidopyrimidine glycosylase [Synechococcus sp. CBW1002]QPN60300.1 DNA-formamidopyrimidine glycosylase [Synechococcus sp. CBW1002]